MSDIKLFRIGSGPVNELTGTTDTIEKSVQTKRVLREMFQILAISARAIWKSRSPSRKTLSARCR